MKSLIHKPLSLITKAQIRGLDAFTPLLLLPNPSGHLPSAGGAARLGAEQAVPRGGGLRGAAGGKRRGAGCAGGACGAT